MNLTTKENRVGRLLENGIPKNFVENIGEIEELKYSVEKTDGAYFYIPIISNYEIIIGHEITPIYDCGDSFCVLAIKDNTKRIIYFELENDEIYRDYGLNWALVLLDIMIDYFDFAIDDGMTIQEFEAVGEKIGFGKSKELFLLRNLSTEEYNANFSDDEKWRQEIAEKLKILS